MYLSFNSHYFQIEISDGGKPPLTSLTRAILTIEDINDHAPQFDQQLYKIRAPATNAHEPYSIFKVNKIASMPHKQLMNKTKHNERKYMCLFLFQILL